MGNVSINGMHVTMEENDEMIESTVKWCIKTKNYILLHRLIIKYGDDVYVHLLLALQDTVEFKDETMCLELLRQIKEWDLDILVSTNLRNFFFDVIRQGLRKVCEYLIKHYIYNVNRRCIDDIPDEERFHITRYEFEPLCHYEHNISPLHVAVIYRQITTARVLLDHGALVSCREAPIISGISEGLYFKQPLEYAIENNDEEMVNLFLDYNVVKSAPEFHRDFLQTALENSAFRIFRLLLDSNVRLDSVYTLVIFTERCYQEGFYRHFFHDGDRETLDEFYDCFFFLFKTHEYLLGTAENVSYPSNVILYEDMEGEDRNEIRSGCFLLDSAMFTRDLNIIKAAIRAGARKCRGSSFAGEPHAPHIKKFVEMELREVYTAFLVSFLV